MHKPSGAGAVGHFAPGSLVCLRRDDGTDSTLLRRRPTSSRTPDAFVSPKVVLTGADRLTYLQTVTADGAAFALVRTAADVEGFVSLKHVAAAAHPEHSHAHHAVSHKHGGSSSDEVPVAGKSGGGVGVARAHGVHHHRGDAKAAAKVAPASSDNEQPFNFDVEWIELWSANGISYFNTKRGTSQMQRPGCFPSSAPIHQRGPIALRSKAIVHSAFIRNPSPPPIVAAHFIDPEDPVAVALPAAAPARPPPPQQTFRDFFACLQKHRQQLGGSRFAEAVPKMKRYTGA
jgi:hypothetical protein